MASIVKEFDEVTNKMEKFKQVTKSLGTTLAQMSTTVMKRDKQGHLLYKRQQFSKQGVPMTTKEGEPIYDFFKFIYNKKAPKGKDSAILDFYNVFKAGKKKGLTFAEIQKNYQKRRRARVDNPPYIAKQIKKSEFNAPGNYEVSPLDNIISDMTPGPIGMLMKGTFGALKAGLKPLKPLFGFIGDKTEKFGISMMKAFGMPNSKIKTTMKAFKQFGKMSLLGGAIGLVVTILLQLLAAMNPFQIIIEALSDIFGVYGGILEAAFLPLIMKLYDVMLSDNAINMVTNLANAGAKMVIAFLPLIDIIAPLVTLFVGGLVIGMNFLATIISGLLTPLNGIGAIFSGLNDIFIGLFASFSMTLKPVFEAIFGFFNSLYSGIYNALGPITEFIGGVFLTAFGLAKGAFMWVGDKINWISGLFTGFVTAIIKGIANFINTLDFLDVFPDVGTVGGSAGSGISDTTTSEDTASYYAQKQADLLEDIAYNTSIDNSRGF